MRSALFAAALTLALAAGGCSAGRGSDTRAGGGGGARGDVPRLIAEADAAIARGDANAARRALDRAIAAAPESASAHLARGRFFVAIRRYKDAKASFDRAASIEPRSAEPRYQLGIAYLAAGERDEARAAFAQALSVNPSHAAARDALAGLLGERYAAAGIPADYPRLGGRAVVSRGELGVVLGVELSADPDRVAWRSDEIQRTSWPELDEAWGSRWLRASLMRRWIPSFPDGSYHLDDPVTRGQLALLLARVAADFGPRASPADTSFADLSARHYLTRPASRAVRWGLPLRNGRFEPLASATGAEVFRAVRGLARYLGATPVIRGELEPG